jgi:hypothetical protein
MQIISGAVQNLKLTSALRRIVADEHSKDLFGIPHFPFYSSRANYKLEGIK